MKMRVTCIALILFLACLVNPSIGQNSTQIPAAPQDHPIALVGGTVHTVTGPALENSTVLFEDGRITRIGTNVTFPPDTEKIDVSGKHIYPGLIDAVTTIGLVEIGAVRATRDYKEVGDVNPNVRAEAAFNPDSALIPVGRANGITLVMSVPQGGLIAGTSALMMMDGWTWEEMTLRAPVGLHIYWPQMVIELESEAEKTEEEQKKERDQQIQILKDAFRHARAYKIARDASKGGTPYHDSDLRWDAIIPVLEKKVPVFIHADEIGQIRAAIRWAEEEDLKMVLVRGYDAWRVAPLLKEKDIPVIYGPVHRLPMRRWESYESAFTGPKKLLDAGVRFCIADFEDALIRDLPYQAATAASYGLPREEALKAVTLYAADILGVSDRVGSIETGKEATLIVTTGDPLEITSDVELEFIQGRKIDLDNKHKELYRKYSEKYRRLQKEQQN